MINKILELQKLFLFCGYFQTLPHLTNGLWLSFLRNPVISMDETFQERFPSLMEIAKAKLYKVFECMCCS